jgi:uncharacterized membrane protein YgcG
MWKTSIVWLVSLMIAGSPRLARAGVHQVWDEAHLFKAETLLEVEPILQEIDARFYKDLMIETFASIPDDLKSTYSKQDVATFYDRWSIVEGNAAKVNGVLILITAQPRHLNVYVGLDTRNKAFTLDDRTELVAILTNAFREANYDAGLISGVKFVRDRMAKNTAPPPATQSTTQPATQPATSEPTPTRPGEISK